MPKALAATLNSPVLPLAGGLPRVLPQVSDVMVVDPSSDFFKAKGRRRSAARRAAKSSWRDGRQSLASPWA